MIYYCSSSCQAVWNEVATYTPTEQELCEEHFYKCSKCSARTRGKIIARCEKCSDTNRECIACGKRIPTTWEWAWNLFTRK